MVSENVKENDDQEYKNKENEFYDYMNELTKKNELRIKLRNESSIENITFIREGISKGKIKLKSDLRRSSSLVKKLKTISDTNLHSLIKDIMELNLTRYISECIIAIMEINPKMTDVPNLIQIITLFHQRYTDFTIPFIQQIITFVDIPFHINEEKNILLKRRVFFRILCELYLIHVAPSHSIISICDILKHSIHRDYIKNNNDNKNNPMDIVFLVTFLKYFSSDFLNKSSKYELTLERRYSGLLKEKKIIDISNRIVPDNISLELYNLFEKAYEYICKMYIVQHETIKKWEKRNENELLNKGDISEIHKNELENGKKIFEKLSTSINTFSDALNKEIPILNIENDDLNDPQDSMISIWDKKNDKDNNESENGPYGDEDTRTFYEDLPDLLDLIPAVVLGLTETEVMERKTKRLNQNQNEDQNEDQDENEDENEKEIKNDFENNIENEDENANRDKNGKEVENEYDNNKIANENEEEVENQANADEKVSNDLKVHNNDENEEEEEDTDENKINEDGNNELDDNGKNICLGATKAHQLDIFFAKFEDLVSRDRCDQLAIEFCYLNSKTARKRLLNTLFDIPRGRLELIPHYCRLLATIQIVLKDKISDELISLLIKEFYSLQRRQHNKNLEIKIRNVMFLGELTKFRLIPPSTIFHVFKKLFNAFHGYNVNVTTNLLENCGRFLYQQNHTHNRMNKYLEIMMRIKKARNFDNNQETLIQNAYYICKPPERKPSNRLKKEKANPLYLYIVKLLYNDLKDTTCMKKVTNQLRKLPWVQKSKDNEGIEKIVINKELIFSFVKAVLKIRKEKFMQMPIICDIIAEISYYHEEISVIMIDSLIEKIQLNIEYNDYREHQKTIALTKLIGEFYNYSIVGHSIIFDMLYNFIHYGHDMVEYSITNNLPIQTDVKKLYNIIPEMRFDPRVICANDGPENGFRIRLVCALLETCGHYFVKSNHLCFKLNRFLTFFQRYFLSKINIPIETEFIVLDLYDKLFNKLDKKKSTKRNKAINKVPFVKYNSWDEADNACKEYFKTDLKNIEKNIHSNINDLGSNNDDIINNIIMGGLDNEDIIEDDRDDEEQDEGVFSDETPEITNDQPIKDDENDIIIKIKDNLEENKEVDEDFEKAFKQMLMTSVESRKHIGHISCDNMSIPSVISHSNNNANIPTNMDHTNVSFKLLRRANKGKIEAKTLFIPENTNLGKNTKHKEFIHDLEKKELKNLVLQNVIREEYEEKNSLLTDIHSNFSNNTRANTNNSNNLSEWTNNNHGLDFAPVKKQYSTNNMTTATGKGTGKRMFINKKL